MRGSTWMSWHSSASASSRYPTAQRGSCHGPEVVRHDLVVDAVFGTGLSRPLEGMLQTVVADVNAAPAPVVAVDLPTGLSADSHKLIGDVIRASVTVTLAAPKPPLVLEPGDEYVGDLVVADIGIPSSVLDGVDGPRLSVLTPQEIRRLISPRASGAHKGDFGRVLVVAGLSRQDGGGMSCRSGGFALGGRSCHSSHSSLMCFDGSGGRGRLHDPSVGGGRGCRQRGCVDPGTGVFPVT